MSTESVLDQSLISGFDFSRLPGAAANLRAQSLKRFSEIGLPTRRSEEWRYTDLNALAGKGLRPALPSAAEVPADVLAVPAPRIVLINGFYSAAHSELGPQVRGFRVRTMTEALKDGSIHEKFFGGAGHGDGLKSLHQAFLADGVHVEISDDVSLENTIHIINLTVAGTEPLLVSPAALVTVGRASRASLVEMFVHSGRGLYWSNAKTAIKLGENARLHHVKIQNESAEAYHVGNAEAEIGAGAVYDSFVFSAGGKVARNELSALLRGTEAAAILNGLYLSREGQVQDCFTVVDHAVAHAKSEQYYKGVLAERSRAVFNGKIIVRRDSQKTDSSQLNRNLLLGPGAEIDTRPQLQIDADDVKCSHGASIGRPNPEELFYLESRGLSREQAGHLLCVGFAEDLVQKIDDKRARHEVQNILTEVFSQMKVNLK